MKKEYEILYGSDLGLPNDKTIITLEEADEKEKLIPLVCGLAKVVGYTDGLGVDVWKDEVGLTIYFHQDKIQIEVQQGDISDWNFNINDITECINFYH